MKRLDYITTRNYISKLITSCRAYRNTAALFDTDHFMVMMQLRYPTTHMQVSLPCSKPRLPKSVINVSSLRTNEQVTKAYSALLVSKLSIDRIPSDIDTLSERIGNDPACGRRHPIKNTSTPSIQYAF